MVIGSTTRAIKLQAHPMGLLRSMVAATLTNYNQNEIFAQEVQKALLAGHTLGQSVEQARELAKERGMSDLVTQLDLARRSNCADWNS